MINCEYGNNYSCAKYDKKEEYNEFIKYVDVSINDQIFIKFNGKRIGPFIQVQSFILTENKQNFYAVVMLEDMKIKFISCDGKNGEIVGTPAPASIVVSPDGNDAHVIINGTMTRQDLTSGQIDIMGMDFSTITEVYIVNINGYKIGPFKEQSLSPANIWYCKTNNNLLYYLDGIVYLNGKKFMAYEEDPACNLWIASDNKTFAISDYQKIVFSDGDTYSFSVEVDCVKVNVKTYLVWAALENETNLLL